MSYKKKSDKSNITIFVIAIGIISIVFFAIISALFSRVFPDEILFFGIAPMSFQSFMVGLLTFMISMITIFYVIGKNSEKD